MIEYKIGQATALEELFVRYKKPIFNYSLRLLRNRADAEDAVAEAFYTLSAKKETYKDGYTFSTWFYTITHNICVDRLRKKKNIISLFFKCDKDSAGYEELVIPDPRPDSREQAHTRERAARIQAAINRLPLPLREAIILREYQSLPYEEIANVMNCSLARVKVLIFRAREKLKNSLAALIAEAQ
ncbi:MAG: sigma-70 family RNA polymerase sigma factor [Candidatus Omnitrophota bacterium]|nr:sigma-70 family RNA polymerase sigma factor [Candidatus Omnitrophota bacterium]